MNKSVRKNIIFASILILIIFLLIVIIFNSNIVGRVISSTSDKCGRIDNSKCVNDSSVRLCLLLFAFKNVNEYSTTGCVDVWKNANPGKISMVDKLKNCALDYRLGKINYYELQDCSNYWNVYVQKIVSSYVAKPIVGNEIGIFTEDGRYFVYLWNYEKWVEKTKDIMKGDYLDETISRWVNEYSAKFGFLPKTIVPIASYYYPSNDGGRIHLWGKVNDKMRLFIYNPSSDFSIVGWYDRTNLLSGIRYDSGLKQWCDNSKCGVLPKNFEILTGYHFYDSNNIGRVNLFGKIDNGVHLLVYNPAINVWYDRTEGMFSGGAGKFSSDFIPRTGFYSELNGGEIYLFGKINPDIYGRITRLYVYNISKNTWSEKSIGGLMLPDKSPQAGYYDFVANKNVIWYNGNLVYTSTGGKYSVSRDYMQGNPRLPPDEYYLTCKNSALTADQQESLSLFNSEFQGMTDEDKIEIQKEYPWMNVNSLTNCDKAFMINEFDEAMSALGGLSF